MDEFKGEFDKEYLNELKQMEAPTQPAVTFVTVVDHDAALQRAREEAEQASAGAKKRRMRTYLNSELPVRPCTSSCPNRGTCKDFLKGKVVDKELCKPELRQIKKWQTAFRLGNHEEIRDDVGSIAGSIMVQIGRLMESVVVEGVMVDQEKFSAQGDTYIERIAHPALAQIEKLVKSLGLDLNSFLMTPKAAKDAPPPVQVNVGVSPDEVQARFMKRFAKQGGDG